MTPPRRVLTRSSGAFALFVALLASPWCLARAWAQGAASTAPREGTGAFTPNPNSAPAIATPPPPPNAPPRLLRFVEAAYPPGAREAGREGAVVLNLTIDPAGHVSDVSVEEGLEPALDEAAVDAARRFEWSPARQNGETVAARIRYRYRFSLRAAASQPATPPSAVLRGAVRNERGAPVADQVLRVMAAAGVREVTTGADGTFRVEGPPASLTVEIARPGYRDFRAQEVLNDRDDLQVVYRLVPVPVAPTAAPPSDPGEREVTVRGTRPPREVTRTTLERREIARIPGTSGDAIRAIQNLPGLARAPFFSGAIIVRGSAPNDSQFFMDGTAIPLLFHFGGLYSVFQTEMLDRIDFYPGNFSARFGRATGGIVDVGFRSPQRQGYRGTVQTSLIDAGLFVEGRITDTLSFAFAGRRSYVDAILGVVLKNVPGVNATALPVYYDYQGVLEWRPSARHRLRLSLFGSDDALRILFERPGDMNPQFSGSLAAFTRFHIAQLQYQHDIAPGLRQQIMISGGYTGIEFTAGEFAQLRIQNAPINLRYEFTGQVGGMARVNVGLDMQTGWALFQVNAIRAPGGMTPEMGGQRISVDSRTIPIRPAFYSELKLTPVPMLRIVPGFRLDYFHEIRQAVFQPRLSFRIEPHRRVAIKGGVGLYAQPPLFQQSSSAANNLFPGTTLGNPSLLPIRSLQYSLGTEIEITPWISLSAEGFYKSLDDLVLSTPTLSLLTNPSTPPFTNDQVGRAYGLEVLLRHKSADNARVWGWIAYTLSRAERRNLPNGEWTLFDQDQTHIFTALATVNLGRGWEAGARMRLVTGSPRTPVVGSFYNADSLSYSPVSGVRNSERNPLFHQLDVRVDKTWRFRRGAFGVFLEVLNVYNATNQEGVINQYNFLQQAPLTGIPIFPNLGLRGEF